MELGREECVQSMTSTSQTVIKIGGLKRMFENCPDMGKYLTALQERGTWTKPAALGRTTA